jgi:hypothetical protein
MPEVSKPVATSSPNKASARGMAKYPEIMAGISIAAYSGRLTQPLGVILAFSNRKPALANTFDFGAGGGDLGLNHVFGLNVPMRPCFAVVTFDVPSRI